MANPNYLLVAFIVAISLPAISAESKDADYVSMSVRVQNGIEERGFRRTKPEEDMPRFLGLCVDNDEINERVIKLFDKPSAENYCKYFASDEFHQFANRKLGDAQRIFYPEDAFKQYHNFADVELRYWRSNSFPPNCIVIFPEDTMIGLRIADLNGKIRPGQIGAVSILRSLVAWDNKKKQERHTSRVTRRESGNFQNSIRSLSTTEITPPVGSDVAGTQDRLLKDMRALMRDGARTVGPATGLTQNTISPYMQDLYSRIKRVWLPPRQRYGPVIVHFKIKKDGSLLMADLRIEKSSGNMDADQSARGAVVNAAPFQPLPDNFPQPYETSVGFDYDPFG